MKKIIILIMLTIFITGCNKKETIVIEKQIPPSVAANVTNLGNVLINKEEITTEAKFINYVVDDIKIQIIVVKKTSGEVLFLFNTCKACNPDSNAYYIQEGKYLICQTCGSKILIDDIKDSFNGCNPFMIDSSFITENIDTYEIDKTYLETFKEKFINLQESI